MNVGTWIHNLLRSNALRVFWSAGAVSVLVDADHIPYLLGWTAEGRSLHLLWGVASLIGGLYYIMVLKETTR
jgi:hypothetical protein